MPELNLNYEEIVCTYDGTQQDTAGGNNLGGGDIILFDLVGAAATAETEIVMPDGYIILLNHLDEPEGQSEPARIDPYKQFKFNVESGGGTSAGPADAYFVSSGADTATTSDEAAGQEIGGDFIPVDIIGSAVNSDDLVLF
jgi:hypothetical protein